jgi:hypothetical protein
MSVVPKLRYSDIKVQLCAFPISKVFWNCSKITKLNCEESVRTHFIQLEIENEECLKWSSSVWKTITQKMVTSCSPSPLKNEQEMYIKGPVLSMHSFSASFMPARRICLWSCNHICPVLCLATYKDPPKSWVHIFFLLPNLVAPSPWKSNLKSLPSLKGIVASFISNYSWYTSSFNMLSFRLKMCYCCMCTRNYARFW